MRKRRRKKNEETIRARSQIELFLQKANLQKLPWKFIKPALFA